jgi:2-dehydro-3-deoxygalactonokinase
MIAIDWGTSSFRAYRLSASGAILEIRSAARGLLTVTDGEFSRVLDEEIADWREDTPIVMCGMIGSRQGWLEVPYVACPADARKLTTSIKSVDWRGKLVHIVPGLSCMDHSGVPDVMRGEETQLLGAMEELGDGVHWVCLPGTHSKWVRIKDRRIEQFSTFMTGELFAVLRDHSILGRMMNGDARDDAAFIAGVKRSGDSGGLLHHLFGVRAQGLLGKLFNESSASYLSGLLIGHELRSVSEKTSQVNLLGATHLVAAYSTALSTVGMPARILDPNSGARGLFLLSRKDGS